MKKFLYTAFMLLAIGATFVACSEDEETGLNPSKEDTQALAHGTYEGKWMRVLDTDTLRGTGTITLAPTDSAYCVNVTIKSVELSLDATSVANIAQEGSHGFVFYNMSTSNGLGANNFRGYIRYDEEGNKVASINFVKNVRVGRKSYEYAHSFSGNLVE